MERIRQKATESSRSTNVLADCVNLLVTRVCLMFLILIKQTYNQIFLVKQKNKMKTSFTQLSRIVLNIEVREFWRGVIIKIVKQNPCFFGI